GALTDAAARSTRPAASAGEARRAGRKATQGKRHPIEPGLAGGSLRESIGGQNMRRRPLIWIFFAAVCAAGAWLANDMLTPKVGTAVSRSIAPIGRLPANATNVTYYLRPPAA